MSNDLTGRITLAVSGATRGLAQVGQGYDQVKAKAERAGRAGTSMASRLGQSFRRFTSLKGAVKNTSALSEKVGGLGVLLGQLGGTAGSVASQIGGQAGLSGNLGGLGLVLGGVTIGFAAFSAVMARSEERAKKTTEGIVKLSKAIRENEKAARDSRRSRAEGLFDTERQLVALGGDEAVREARGLGATNALSIDEARKVTIRALQAEPDRDRRRRLTNAAAAAAVTGELSGSDALSRLLESPALRAGVSSGELSTGAAAARLLSDVRGRRVSVGEFRQNAGNVLASPVIRDQALADDVDRELNADARQAAVGLAVTSGRRQELLENRNPIGLAIQEAARAMREAAEAQQRLADRENVVVAALRELFTPSGDLQTQVARQRNINAEILDEATE